MKFKQYLLLLITAALFSGCSTMKVKTDRTAAFDFSTIRSYEWIQPNEAILEKENTYFHEGIETLIKAELSDRNWTAVEKTDEADVQVSYYIELESHEEYASAQPEDRQGVSGGFTYKEKGWGRAEQDSGLQTYTVETGTLTVQVFDAHSKAQIWIGTLKTNIDRSKGKGWQKKKGERIIERLFRKLPTR